jgi:Ras-related GTP-binding protein C/D
VAFETPNTPTEKAVSETEKVQPSRRTPKDLFYPSAATSLSGNLSGTTIIYHLVNPRLALVAVLPTAIFESKRGLVEANAVIFREGILEICDAEELERRPQVQ